MHVAARLAGSRASEILAVVGSRGDEVAGALRAGGSGRLNVVDNRMHEEGIGGSIRAGMVAVSETADAVVIALADMPEIDAADIDRLIGAYDPVAGSGICRFVGPDGNPAIPCFSDGGISRRSRGSPVIVGRVKCCWSIGRI